MKVETTPKVDHTPAELDEGSKVMLAAAALIESKGHRKGTYGDAQRGYCLLGALHAAAGADPYDDDVPLLDDVVDKRLCPAIGINLRTDHISRWNDAEERTAAEVIAKLRAVALGL